MKRNDSLLNYLLLSSLDLVSSPRELKTGEIELLLAKSLDAEFLNIIYDYCNSEDSGKWKKIGLKALDRAVNLGSPAALYSSAKNSKDSKKAFSLFKAAAKRGDPWSALNLGWCYFNGVGTKRDLKKAKKYYEVAAKSKLAPAFYNLGLMARHNNDDKNADLYFRKATSLGHARSMLLLAKSHIKKERKMSKPIVELLKRAHSLGEIEAGDILRLKGRILSALKNRR